MVGGGLGEKVMAANGVRWREKKVRNGRVGWSGGRNGGCNELTFTLKEMWKWYLSVYLVLLLLVVFWWCWCWCVVGSRRRGE